MTAMRRRPGRGRSTTVGGRARRREAAVRRPPVEAPADAAQGGAGPSPVTAGSGPPPAERAVAAGGPGCPCVLAALVALAILLLSCPALGPA